MMLIVESIPKISGTYPNLTAAEMYLRSVLVKTLLRVSLEQFFTVILS